MFIAELFIIAKNCKQLKCPSTDKWINKLEIYIYFHTVEYYSAMKRDEVLTQLQPG